MRGRPSTPVGTLALVAIVRMFASARTAAGRGRDEVPGDTVEAVLGAARQRYGATFAEVLSTCRIWVNGEPATASTAVASTDEVAVLPPVSGGAA
jgi:molybdopterin converting factor small subunit